MRNVNTRMHIFIDCLQCILAAIIGCHLAIKRKRNLPTHDEVRPSDAVLLHFLYVYI